MTDVVGFAVVAAVGWSVAAGLLADRWVRRHDLGLKDVEVLRLKHDLVQQVQGNLELASFVAVTNELVEIHIEADESSTAASAEWLGRQVESHLRELLALGWEFDADLEHGGFRARREL